MLKDYRSISDAFLDVCKKSEKKLTFIKSNKTETFITYHDIAQKSLQLLGYLEQMEVKKGTQMILFLESQDAFVYSFWACLLGKIVVVPLPSDCTDENFERINNIIPLLDSPCILTQNHLRDNLRPVMDHNPRCRIVLFDSDMKLSGNGTVQQGEPDDDVMLQFSSGSTGVPKGVMLTNRNILHNVWGHYVATSIQKDESILSWLPLHHNYGLIVGHVTSILCDIDQFLLATSLFGSDPLAWMDKVSEHGVTRTFTSNYGLRYVLEGYDAQRASEWDFSQLKIIYNGSEMISKVICDKFVEIMKQWNLSSKAIFSVYGLTEGTVLVSVSSQGEGHLFHYIDRNGILPGNQVEDVQPEKDNCLIVCDLGYPIPGYQMRVLDEEGNVLPENTHGHIEFKGVCVAKGYYKNDVETRKAISEDGWLRTGDNGFVRNGRLIVTGRSKNIIIVNGVNYYPEDLEQLVEEADQEKRYKSVVCGIPSEVGEEVYVFVVFHGDAQSFVNPALEIRAYLSRKLGIPISGVLPITKIPKTASGKSRRFQVRDMYLNGEFVEMERTMKEFIAEKRAISIVSQDVIENNLIQIFRKELLDEEIDAMDSFQSMYINSLMVMRLYKSIDTLYPDSCSASTLYACSNIQQVADIIRKKYIPEAISLPDNYFVEMQAGERRMADFPLSSTKELLQQMEGLARENGISLEAVLIAFFLKVLHEASQEAEIEILVKDSKFADKIRLNFDILKNYQNLFLMVEGQFTDMKRAQSTFSFTVPKNYGSNTILPVFSLGGQSDRCDLILEFERNGYTLTCTYDANRLCREQIGDMMKEYIKLLEDLVTLSV